MRLNRWRSGKILIRSLPAIPTAGLSLDDMPRLMAQCREQMRECIESMDRQVQSA
jgi:1-acyl-sn-glycerol-3-phosphate acyltransferase